MIKLKTLLMESEKSFKAWWLDPSAKFHEVYKDDPQYGHFYWARDYLQKNKSWDMSNPNSPSYILIRDGWIRVTFNYYGDSAIHFDYSKSKKPSQKQMKELKDLAIELNGTLFDDSTNGEIDLLQEEVLKEYLQNPVIYLKKYLNMSAREQKEDLANHNPHLVLKWIEEERSYDTTLSSKLDEEGYDVIEFLKDNLPEDYTDFLDWIYGKLESREIESEAPPSWYILDYREDIKNQWLIHFSDNAKDVWMDQKFKYGLDDLYYVGYTTQHSIEAKKYGGYNFAYALGDYLKYARSSYRSKGWKYGKEAVIFRASGIKAWHHGDEEPQVIFWGPSTHDVVYIQELDGDWGVTNSKSGRVIYRGEFPDVVKWIVTNFNQYKSALLP